MPVRICSPVRPGLTATLPVARTPSEDGERIRVGRPELLETIVQALLPAFPLAGPSQQSHPRLEQFDRVAELFLVKQLDREPGNRGDGPERGAPAIFAVP